MVDEDKKPEEVTEDSAVQQKEEAKPKEEPKAEEAPAPADKPATPAEEEKKEVDTSNLSKDAIKVVEMVEKMAVLELAELVKVLEEKFGVSAAAPVAVAAGGSSAGQQNEGEEKTEFNVNLVAAGSNKIGAIKAVRAVTDLGLKEAKDLVEAAPKVVKENVKKAEAEEMKKTLEEAGATVELQ